MGLGAIGLAVGPSVVFARQSTGPVPQVKDPKYRNWSEDALKEARRLGCSYADIRFTFNRSNGVAVRNGQITGSGSIGFGNFGDEETYGFGVRVIHGGVWGFASSPVVTPEEIKRIVDIQLELLIRRLEDRKLTISLTDQAKEVLAREGYDPVYGARPLKRAIQRHIQDLLAMKLIDGEFREGDHILVDATPTGELVFERTNEAPAALV